MVADEGYAEDSRMGKAYDLGLLKRLLPFIRPYQRLLIGSLLLVVVITVLDLALPYFSKIAIDRFIVPAQSSAIDPPGAQAGQERRLVSVSADTPRIRSIIERHPDLFQLQGDTALIVFENLNALPRSELVILRRQEINSLTLVVLVFVVVILADFGLTFGQRMLMEFAGHRIMHDMRIRLFTHILGQSMSFFTRQPVARLVTRVTNDVQNMHELFTTFVSMVFKDIFLLVGIAVVLLVLDWRLALIGFVVLPIMVVIAVRFSIRARDVYRALRIKVSDINTRINETIDGIKTIQTFVQEDSNHRRFAAVNDENLRLGMQEIHIFALFMPLIEMLGFAAVAAVILYGGLQVLDADISLGVLVAAIAYIRMFFNPLRDLAENYNVLQNAMASAERIFGLLDTREQLPTAARTVDAAADRRPARSAKIPNPGRPIEFEQLSQIDLDQVSFAYVPGDWVVHDVSFSLRRGETVALVGPTGAGKTSLLSLILRFYDPGAGRIRINGVDLRQWDTDRLRAMTALVPQDPMLFTGTVRQNIFDNPEVVDEQSAARVLRDANCQDLVQRLPAGLDTRLVKGGAGLSSGERQLITIARAFARNPQLILLDEATSYIDSHTEAAIHQALHNLTAGRTCLLVAHRLSTARTADRIVVMHQGRVREIGTHDQLMAKGELYWRLHQHSEG